MLIYCQGYNQSFIRFYFSLTFLSCRSTSVKGKLVGTKIERIPDDQILQGLEQRLKYLSRYSLKM